MSKSKHIIVGSLAIIVSGVAIMGCDTKSEFRDNGAAGAQMKPAAPKATKPGVAPGKPAGGVQPLAE